MTPTAARFRDSRESQRLLLRRHVEVHALDADSARSGKAVEDQVARAAEQAGPHLDLLLWREVEVEDAASR